MIRITRMVWKFWLSCLVGLVLSHVILDVVFVVLFQHSLAGMHLSAAALHQMKQMFSLASGIALVVTGALCWYLARRITAPLREMDRAARQIAGGAFDRRVAIMTRDEVGDLGATFNAMAAELARRDDLRQTFVANVSHDLRSPLTAIRGFVSAFLDGTLPADRQRHALTVMADQTDRMIKLVNDLLDLARIDAGQFAMQPDRFNLSEMVRRVVARMEPEWDHWQITVEVVADAPHDIEVVADQDRIDQVLVNLVQNAIHWSPPGSIVEVRVHQADQAVIAIQDAGPGIPPEEVDVIWDRFYKGEHARTKQAGTGIGLSIVKHILDLHHSPITVQSDVGHGATFTFSLPLAPGS